MQLEQVDARPTRHAEGQHAACHVRVGQYLGREGGDDGARGIPAGQGDGLLREAAIDLDAEERGDALDQHVVVEREDPQRAVLPRDRHDALEILQALAVGIPALDLPAVEHLVHDLREPGVEGVVGLGETLASIVEVARLEMREQGLVVELLLGEEARHVFDDLTGVAKATRPPGVVQLAQRRWRQPGQDLGVHVRAQGHAQFAGRACAKEESREHGGQASRSGRLAGTSSCPGSDCFRAGGPPEWPGAWAARCRQVPTDS